MTTQVSGDLRVITSTPAKITSVDVRSTTTRPSGDGLMLGQWVTLSKPGEFNAASGEVDFPAVPGPAQIKLFSGGSTVGSVALIVPDTPTATLADCVRNAEMAGDRDVGELAGILEQIRESVGAAGEARAGAEAAAEDAAGSAASAGRDATRAEAAAGEAEGSAEGAGVSAGVALSAAGAAGESASSASSSATRAETAQAHAEEARDDALEGADRVGTAERVLEAEQSAAQSAADAAGDADRAETAANLVGTAAELETWTSQAVGAAQTATTEAGRAAEEADRAAGAAAAEVEKLKGDAPEAFDTLEEIADELGRNESERAALANTISGKADKDHTHVSADVTDAVDLTTTGTVGQLVKTSSTGNVQSYVDPTEARDLTRKSYVDTEVARKADNDELAKYEKAVVYISFERTKTGWQWLVPSSPWWEPTQHTFQVPPGDYHVVVENAYYTATGIQFNALPAAERVIKVPDTKWHEFDISLPDGSSIQIQSTRGDVREQMNILMIPTRAWEAFSVEFRRENEEQNAANKGYVDSRIQEVTADQWPSNPEPGVIYWQAE